MQSSLPKRCLAEIIGTFGLVFATAGANVVDELSDGRITHLGVGIVSGLIISAMIYAVGHISGAHFNPAVTLGFAVGRHFPLKEVPFYWVSQLLGAVTGAFSLRALFGEVGIMGGTVPRGSTLESFGFEIPLTFILMFVIMAVATDSRAKGSARGPRYRRDGGPQLDIRRPDIRCVDEPGPVLRSRAGRLELGRPLDLLGSAANRGGGGGVGL